MFMQPNNLNKWGVGGRMGTGYEQWSCLAADVGMGGKQPLCQVWEQDQQYCSGRLGATRLRAGSAGQTGHPAGNRAPALV